MDSWNSPLRSFVCLVTTFRASERLLWGIHIVAGLGSQFRGLEKRLRPGIHLSVREWRYTLSVWNPALAGCPAGLLFRQTMHELSIMQSALDQVLEKARQAGASRVHAIRLRIGALSGVVPDALQFAFEALADGTPAQGAQLLIEDVPARFWCAACSHEFEATRMFAECPDCHRPSAELRAGREMELTSLEVD